MNSIPAILIWLGDKRYFFKERAILEFNKKVPRLRIYNKYIYIIYL